MGLFLDLDSVPNPSPPGSTPSTARVWLGAASSDFSSGHNLGALSTGLVINTAGVPSVVAHGTNTHVLTMVAGVPTWAAPSGGGGAGDIEGVTAGAGLTGGGTTGTVTLDVVAADGTIIVNSDSIQVGQIANANVAAGAAIDYSKLSQSGNAASVLGRSAGSAGALAPILSGANGQVLIRIGGAVNFGQLTVDSAAGTQTNGFALTIAAGVPTWAAVDHGALAGLGDDDHAQYALLAGRSGGQTLIGGTTSGDDLTLQSTSNATRGTIDAVDDFRVTRSASGATVTATVANASNTASSKAIQLVQVAGSTADDAVYQVGISGGQTYSFGVDNSVATDPFVMSAGATLGTSNFLSVSTTTTTGLELRNPGSAGPALLSLNDTSGAVLSWSSNALTIAGAKTTLLAGSCYFEAVHSTNNFSFGALGSFGSGTGVIFIANRTAAPSSDPSGGGILYTESGALKFRGSSGTVTTICPA